MDRLIALIMVFTISSIVFIYNYKNKGMIWFSYMGFIVSIGILGTYLNNHKDFLLIGNILYIFSYCFAPYFFLIASIRYVESNTKMKVRSIFFSRFVTPILPVFSFGMCIIFYNLLYGKAESGNDIYLRFFITLWAIIYYFVGDYNLFNQFLQEKIPILKHQKFYIFLLLFFATSYGVLSNHIIPILKIKNTYDFCFSVILFICFLYFCIRHGFFGLRIFFEKYNPIINLMTMDTGISILNHTLKNEMNKIDICCNNIKVQTNKQNEIIDRNVNSIKNSSEHILNMVSRIKKYTYDFSIVESNFELTNIIEKVVEMMNPYIEKKHISIIKDFGYCTNMIADCSHIQEVLLSLLKNSVEAINHKGEILIKTKRNNKFIIIEVIDNGCGINKNNLKRIVHPFFTTKNNTTNFGLGLAYSSNVILKHGGKLLISSHEGIGTKVSICLPISRIPGAIKNKNLG